MHLRMFERHTVTVMNLTATWGEVWAYKLVVPVLRLFHAVAWREERRELREKTRELSERRELREKRRAREVYKRREEVIEKRRVSSLPMNLMKLLRGSGIISGMNSLLVSAACVQATNAATERITSLVNCISNLSYSFEVEAPRKIQYSTVSIVRRNCSWFQPSLLHPGV